MNLASKLPGSGCVDQIESRSPMRSGTHVKTDWVLDDGKTRAPFDLDRVFRMFPRTGFAAIWALSRSVRAATGA